MLRLLSLVAVMCAALFAGAALYINVAEQRKTRELWLILFSRGRNWPAGRDRQRIALRRCCRYRRILCTRTHLRVDQQTDDGGRNEYDFDRVCATVSDRAASVTNLSTGDSAIIAVSAPHGAGTYRHAG